MNINGSNIMFSEEDRELLRKFFSDNFEYIKNNSFIEYENIKAFGDLYESFIDENGLRGNDILMLFLAEIRYDQIAYKITNNTVKMRAARLAIPKNRLNATISKWYKESNISYYVQPTPVNKSLKMKLEQNAYERQASLDEAAHYIVR